MENTFNNPAAFAVFDDADRGSLDFATRLLALGIGDRATAKPYAMAWAAKRYNVQIEQGQRGAKLPRDSAAEKAMHRVLQVCFPSADIAKPKTTNHKTDNVAKLLKAYSALTSAERRRFLASL